MALVEEALQRSQHEDDSAIKPLADANVSLSAAAPTDVQPGG